MIKSKQLNNDSIACKHCTVFEEISPGFPTPNSPEFAEVESYNTYLTVRRVRREGEPDDEVQISVMLTQKYRSGRTRQQAGCIVLNPVDADLLVKSIVNVRP